MEKIKLVDYQVKDIKSAIPYDEVYDRVLDKYKVFMIEDLNATDYEDIINDIQDWHKEIISRPRSEFQDAADEYTKKIMGTLHKGLNNVR